jgi:hypothetical protein
MLSFPEQRHEPRSSPYGFVIQALVRLLERTCPLPPARTLPDNLREVLVRLEAQRPAKRGRTSQEGKGSRSRAREAGSDHAS